jgi:parvulin-like peptidyl-prolyl isomerase
VIRSALVALAVAVVPAVAVAAVVAVDSVAAVVGPVVQAVVVAVVVDQRAARMSQTEIQSRRMFLQPRPFHQINQRESQIHRQIITGGLIWNYPSLMLMKKNHGVVSSVLATPTL